MANVLNRSLSLLPFAVTSLCGVGCGTQAPAAGEEVAEVTSALSVEYNSQVVGRSGSMNFDDNQAEAVVSVNKDADLNRVITTTYNDGSPPTSCLPTPCHELDGHMYYTSGPTGTRYVTKGASQLGWSYSTDDGVNWNKHNVLAPPAGQAVLWGDPAIATCPNGGCSEVYITNLAISNTSFDSHSVYTRTYGYALEGSVATGVIDGACIARSTDAGKNFSVLQCVTNAGHFYDGSSVAIGGSSGPVFAAWNDVTTGLIDVWRAPSFGGTFVRIASPPLNAATHPRIRAVGGNLYVATQDGNGNIYMSLWNGSTWGAAKFFAGTNGAINPDVHFTSHYVRTGPQFSFEVATFSAGAGSSSCSTTTNCVDNLCNGGGGTCLARCVAGSCVWEDQVRLAYTYYDGNNKLKIAVNTSGLDLAAVHAVPEWGTASQAGDQYNPAMSAFRGQIFVGAADWHMAYQSRESDPSGSTVTLRHTRPYLLINNIPFALHQNVMNYENVCPDLRSGGAGYWGDYNDIAWLGVTGGGSNRWITTYTDSTAGCPTQYNFFSEHAHVGSAVVDN